MTLPREQAREPDELGMSSARARQAMHEHEAAADARRPIEIGVDDDSIPFTESLRLAGAAGDRGQLALLRTFHHTGAQTSWDSWSARVGDAWHVARLADALLRFDRPIDSPDASD